MTEKVVLVGIPAAEKRRKYFEERAAGGNFACSFRYIPASEVTEADLRDVSAVIGNVSPPLLAAAPELEWVQLNSAGADPYVKPGILRQEQALTCASGAYGLSVSEHMLALTFGLVRKMGFYHHNQEQRLWRTEGSVTSIEGATVLVLGLGDIGGSYARKIRALGARCVIGVRRTESAKPDYLDEQYTMEALHELLPRADIVAMALPGGSGTTHVMNDETLRLMKKGAYLINAGRGSSVDPEALRAVLEEGLLGGAGLDVTEPEPLPADDPLWDMPNVLITPHVAGQFFLQETFERIVRIAGGNLEAWTHGKELTHQVNRSAGY
ncbi:D-2-hydroxyacid dehydrogenase [Lachnoclostridium sp. Marseille-P6806]|uniref:D-2-hydroxyacid dehydrogenase n=1 Tax=Lachnoclostridium sp. Marseille-P6806 TaxID=2364793 RepID=UPI0010303E60|nr:D-2-hydroxyacid dehydrogenase [Lachnoclostridium sp. Marseille-P6806]